MSEALASSDLRQTDGLFAVRQTGRRLCSRLLAQAERIDELAIRIDVLALEVVKELAAAADHLKQTAAGVMILLVFLEVAGQRVDAGRQKSDLNLRRTGITGRTGKLGNDFSLVDLFRHVIHLNNWRLNVRCRCRGLHRERKRFIVLNSPEKSRAPAAPSA